ncbi:hypothetical protein [Streptosporangium pseudovulgare]|uniref:Uncharacterized protein n=1 Tax=Streptosporangium pseudovulgare TaxID=35765 RepID=A0ABQ2RDK3_9ACTN|nr:hypothetical protein [Streptosporangium pseudovulgare]GGQ23693.1 hypothetical protein GCM10010140_62470 [Streptosporangium pseudovulgare]
MPPPEMTNGAGAITPERRPNADVPINATITHSVGHRGIPVTAIAYAPAGRRTRWLSVVEHCPHCHGSHLHRGTPEEPAGDVRAAGCGRGHYLVIPTARPAVAR